MWLKVNRTFHYEPLGNSVEKCLMEGNTVDITDATDGLINKWIKWGVVSKASGPEAEPVREETVAEVVVEETPETTTHKRGRKWE